MRNFFIPFLIVIIAFVGCKTSSDKSENNVDTLKTDISPMKKKVNEYAKVKLFYDLNTLTENQRKMIPLLLDAAQIMDEIFWQQRFGNKDEFINSILDEDAKQFALINYGPWDQLDGSKPFIEGFGEKPAGAQFYPADMTKEEFEKLNDANKASLYTMIRRNEKGELYSVKYNEFFKEKTQKAADLILEASKLADDAGLKKYLELRSKALLTDEYFESDIAWMSMKNNIIDFVVGPIENYEDGLFGYKAAHEAFLLIKDKEWSAKLEKFAKLLPDLQKSLPVEQKFKTEVPGSDSDLGVYYALYYAGDCNSGSKTIAINLPNDEKVQLQKGTRKLQLKNSMQAKFDKILLPISDILIDESQRKYIKFDAFFENVMFHEVGHGLGIKNTINKKGTVRETLKEQYSAVEEAKADIMGLYLVSKLYEMGEFPQKDMMDNYVTFMAGIFRSVRFGASSSHGKANMMTFYFFEQMEAFTRDKNTGLYSVNFDKMTLAINALVDKIIVLQGNGDYDNSKKWVETDGVIKEELKADLEKVATAGIPKDIVFEQGKDVLGIK